MDSSVFFQLWRKLQTLAKLFRFVELFTALMLLSWVSTRLPFAVRMSGEFLCKTVSLLFCPTSVFLLGNAIVVTLLAKSGLFSSETSSSAVDIAVADLCRKLRSDEGDVDDGVEPETTASLFDDKREEIVFQDKEVIVVEEKRKELSYRRTKSERFKTEEPKKEKEKLRRSETDVCRGSKSAAEVAVDEGGGCGGEEFRRTIEEFIAKQVKFHREESLAVVIHGQA